MVRSPSPPPPWPRRWGLRASHRFGCAQEAHGARPGGPRPYGAIELTEQGRALAVEMVRRHRLIETFLVEMLSATAGTRSTTRRSTLEHATSRLHDRPPGRSPGAPLPQPHGDPIPAKDGTITSPTPSPSPPSPDGSRVRVERISTGTRDCSASSPSRASAWGSPGHPLQQPLWVRSRLC
ncbi:iron dependent repressor, metal binding and dimerization domain protein [Kocuria rhizophila]|nr:iron dependent repressor, metal binding and dimerization domain protein [Kocuria rhizophila]